MTTPNLEMPILSVVWVGDGKSRTPAQTSTKSPFYQLKPDHSYTAQVNNLTTGTVRAFWTRGAAWESRQKVAVVEAGKTTVVGSIPAMGGEDTRIVVEFATAAASSERVEVMLIGRPIATS